MVNVFFSSPDHPYGSQQSVFFGLFSENTAHKKLLKLMTLKLEISILSRKNIPPLDVKYKVMTLAFK